MSEWLAKSNEGFYEQCGKWKTALEDEAARTTYNWDATECGMVLRSITSFMTAYDTYKEVNSTRNRIAKDETKSAASGAIRAFAASSVRYNPRMDDAARFTLGIRPRDTTPTPQQRPTSQPHVVIENTVNYFEHRIKAVNNETGTSARPDDAHGVQFAWQIGGVRPSSGSDLPKGRFTRRTTITNAYNEADSGQMVYYAACYENARGEAGPWSPVTEAPIR